MNNRKASPVILGAVSVAFLVWASVFIYKSSFLIIGGERYFCLFDDAMISLRYAWNLAHGKGLVWNPGDHTEGFTNMLMTLIMAIPSALFEKRFAVLAVQAFGAVTMVAVGYFSMRIGFSIMTPGRTATSKIVFGVLFFAAPLLYYPLCYWTLMGMETGLLALLLYGAIFLSTSEKHGTQFHPALPIALGCAFWTRPDASIPIACILFFRAATIWRSGRPKNTIFFDTLIVAGFFGSLTLFRWLYYGQIFPNTYTLKMANIPLELRLENGLGYMAQFLSNMWFPLILGVGGLILNPHGKTVLIAVLIVLANAYQIYAGGDPWLYWRLLSPYTPLIFLLALGAVPHMIDRLNFHTRKGHRARENDPFNLDRVESAAAVTVACLFFGFANYPFRYEAILVDLPYNVEFNHATVSAAKAIDEVTDKDATVGVFWAGSIPYYTGREAIDFLGKTDRYIASLPPDTSGKVSWRGMKSVPGHNKYDLDYSIVRNQPTYVQGGKWGGQNVYDFLKANYRGVYYQGVPLMLRKDSPSVDWNLLGKKLPVSPHATPLGRIHEIP